MNNPYAWLVLAFCTIAAFGFAIITWIFGKRKKEISFVNNSYKIIEKGKSLIPELEINFKKRNIDKLTITKYAIWNSGNEVIEYKDIVDTKTLKIISLNQDTIILDASIVSESDETNKFSIDEIKDNYAKIKFDYIGPKDGIVIQVLYSGEETSLDVECKIKGGKAIKNIKKKILKYQNRKRNKLIATVLMGIQVFLYTVLAVTIILVENNIVPKNILLSSQYHNSPILEKTMMVLMSVLVLSMIFMYVDRIKRMYHFDIPVKIRNGIEYNDLD